MLVNYFSRVYARYAEHGTKSKSIAYIILESDRSTTTKELTGTLVKNKAALVLKRGKRPF